MKRAEVILSRYGHLDAFEVEHRFSDHRQFGFVRWIAKLSRYRDAGQKDEERRDDERKALLAHEIKERERALIHRKRL